VLPAFSLAGTSHSTLFRPDRFFPNNLTFLPFTCASLPISRVSISSFPLFIETNFIVQEFFFHGSRYYDNLIIPVLTGLDHLPDPDFSREAVLFPLFISFQQIIQGLHGAESHKIGRGTVVKLHQIVVAIDVTNSRLSHVSMLAIHLQQLKFITNLAFLLVSEPLFLEGIIEFFELCFHHFTQSKF